MPAPPVFRFAPSPNGRLHLGHALSALTGEAWATRLGGRFLVRIEDIDVGRTRPEFVDGISEDLTWLGITWETPVLRQSEHFAVYAQAAERLTAMGLLYPCFATRTEIAAAAQPGAVDPEGTPLVPGLHSGLPTAVVSERKALGEPYCLRLDMPRALAHALAHAGATTANLTFTEMNENGTTRITPADPARWGDVVLVRKDTPTSYHLSVVVDDARQHITHVTRGLDLYPATDLHRLLQVLLDLPEPIYAHHATLTDADGHKLSKSAGAESLADLRARGMTATDVRARLGFGSP